MLLCQQVGDERDHLLDIFGSAWHVVRRTHAQRRQIGSGPFDIALRQLSQRNPLLGGARDYLVINVGVVLDMLDRVPGMLEPAPYGVERDVAACVAQVHVVVDRQAAAVHPHASRLARRELLELATGAVVDLQHTVRGWAGLKPLPPAATCRSFPK